MHVATRLVVMVLAVVLVVMLPARLCAQEMPEAIPADTIAAKVSNTAWIKQLVDHNFDINNPEIQYPRFPNFCRKVYNWGDHTFNTFDSDYVVGTGKNWKLMGKSYNWLQTYSFLFHETDGREKLNIRSNVYADMGAYISFMAVSLGYMWNANEIFGHGVTSRSNFNFNFTCALFTLDFMRQTAESGAKIIKFATTVADLTKDIPFNDIKNTSNYFTGWYFFNHSKYSHGAAYSFTKYQRKSAGSWLAGFQWLRQDIEMDFTALMKEHDVEQVEGIPSAYHFDYDDFTLNGGYGYNCVLYPRRWLFNITSLLGVGYKQTKDSTSDNGTGAVAFDMQINFAFVYNHRALFCGAQGRMLGSFYPKKKYTFFNTSCNLQFIVGMRF